MRNSTENKSGKDAYNKSNTNLEREMTLERTLVYREADEKLWNYNES